MRTTSLGSVLASVLLLVPCACGSSGDTGGSGGGGGGGGGGTAGLTIKGTLGTGAAFRAPVTGAALRDGKLTAVEVTKVVAFSTDRWWSGTVSGGAFQIQVDSSAPVGLVFAGAANQFLGSMVLPSGFAAIPVQATTSGVKTIDLGTAMGAGTSITPSHDPVGAEILLGAADQAALKLLEGAFGAVIRNPDADGDGQVDVLQDRFYRPYILYFVGGGRFTGGVGTPDVPAGIFGYRFGVQIQDGGAFPDTVTFTGPPGSGLSGVPNDQLRGGGSGWANYGSPFIQSPVVPPPGRYVINAGARTLGFDIPDQGAATAHVALAVPTVTLNADGTMQKLSWTYRLGDQSGTVKPEALIHDIIVQVEGNGSPGVIPCPANGGVAANQGSRIYNSPNLGPTVTEHVFGCQNLPWTAVNRIFMAYSDVYGNHVVVDWDR